MKILLFILILLISGLLLWAILPHTPNYSVRPITDFRLTQQIAPEDWVGISKRGGPVGTGWVLIPKTPTDPKYSTNINPAARGFLSADVCGECHRENYESFLHTAHAITSAEPSRAAIRGSFDNDENLMKTGNPNLWFEMTTEDERFYQELHVRDGLMEFIHRRPFDLVLGSGNHGQSYLYWEGDQLYQLHVSYLSELQQWVNSPGMYVDGTADFARPVPGRCLDCHATWFAEDRRAINRFDRHTYLLGVTCVRCHGAGHEHVAWHRQFPEEAEGKRIVTPAQLPRDRLNELCAQCHSAGEPTAAAFAYPPGQPLSEYLQLDFSAVDASNDDPHSANQLARLMQSKCYQHSETLTCVSCHDPHRDQRGQTEEFSRRCVQCHMVESCEERKSLGAAIDKLCVECHMPARRDVQVRVEMGNGAVSALIRDHKIGVWASATQRLRQQIWPREEDR